MTSKHSKPRPALSHRHLGVLGSASTVLALIACSATSDVTELDVEWQAGVDESEIPHSAVDEPTYPGELERMLAENEARLAEWKREAAERAASLTEEERAALARYVPVSREQEEAEWVALQRAALTAEEEQATRALLESRGSRAADLHFAGRTVLDGDVLHRVDDLLGTATVDKAHIPLGVQTEDSVTGEPIPSTSPDYIPVSLSSKTATDIRFWRPETNRKYFVVLPDSAPPWLYTAMTQATSDIMSALSDDCLGSNLFVVMSLTGYSQLDELTRLLGSEISVSRGPNACSERADACAGFPRTECLMQSPIDCANRMRLGKFIRFDTTFDGNDDGVPDPVTEANARSVALHELTHILGFSHPTYPDFDPAGVAGRVRVPTTADGTVPSVMAPSSDPRFSSTLTADDRQALRKTYGSSCAYTQGYRVMGRTCQLDDLCLQHGGACEVDAGGVEQCRWHHHKDSNSCVRYSAGKWTTAAASVLPGEPGACILPAGALSTQDPLDTTTATASANLAGRRCIQDTRGPGVLFFGLSTSFAATYYCSDQKSVWDPDDWASWEFTSSAEQADFNQTSNNWQVSSGNYTNWANEAENFAIARGQSLTHGCVSTRVRTTDNGFSGIVFNYRNSEDYYVFDLQPSVRRRIRRIGRLPDGTVGSRSLSSINLNYAADWSAGITLTVCFGDGVHAFIDNGNRISVTSVPDYFDDDRDGNVTEVLPVKLSSAFGFGLYNSFNQASRHAYLRTFPLVHGFALAQ